MPKKLSEKPIFHNTLSMVKHLLGYHYTVQAGRGEYSGVTEVKLYFMETEVAKTRLRRGYWWREPMNWALEVAEKHYKENN